jgi:hypothetical protein
MLEKYLHVYIQKCQPPVTVVSQPPKSRKNANLKMQNYQTPPF